MNDDATLASPLPPEGGTPLPASLSDLKKPRNYAVGDTHARGGMGAILCAKDLNINRTVAMKVMLGDRAADAELASRFVDEAKITGQLEHPNIVPVHELGVDEEGRPFYTMKFVMGVTLKQVLDEIKEGKPETLTRYSLAHLLTIFQKTCDAVAFAHARGVVHRDLKPENIMLGEFGEVLVLDWGLAKQLGKSETASDRVGEVADSGRTMDGTIMGTPQFMSPEQAEGQIDRIDARTDIYALGGILYNLLTLQPPVTGNNVNEVLDKVRTGQITPCNSGGPRSVVATSLPHLPDARIPDSLSAVAMKAMALVREDRYQSVKELQLDIEAYQNGFATLAENASAWKQFTLFIKRHKAVSISVAASLLLLTGVSTAFTWRVIGERNRAENALTRLRKTAPNFYDQARVLTERQKFAEALDKIDTAIALDDTKPEFHAQRGNILQSLMKFGDAAASYKRALALNPQQPFAADNLALSEKLNDVMAKDRQISRELLMELYAACRKQERVGEALALGSQFRTSIKEQLPLWQAKMRAWLGSDKLTVHGDGFLYLILRQLPITDIEPLRGIPIKILDLTGTKVRDLSPLAGMPLEVLNAQYLGLDDIAALRGLPLKSLDLIGNRNLKDLSPLTGIALEKLYLDNCMVSDLSPLRGMPLRELYAGSAVADLSPLAGMPLERLTVSSQVRDISVLRGMPLKVLIAGNTRIRDLSPLAGMPLQRLEITKTDIADISPLRGMPLQSVNIDGCRKSIDLSPLAECPTLETIVLPVHPVNVAALRKLPKLRTISGKPAEQFWKEYDAAKAKAVSVNSADTSPSKGTP